jgi:hypothetical protein
MTIKDQSLVFRLRPLLVGLSLAFAANGAHAADEPAEPTGLLSAAKISPNGSSLFKSSGLTLGGWLQGGVTVSNHDSNTRFNGPVTFNDRDSEFQLNQLYLYLQRAVATEGDSFDIGGRADFLFGTDAIYTQAYGVPAYDVNTLNPLVRSTWDLNFLRNTNRFYDIALPQLYLEAYIPVGNGLNLKAGHFYTPIGYEVVTAPDNFFYSHAYTMQYGEPFTHTGLLANYSFDKNWSVVAGLLTGSATGGWDGGWDRQLGNWSGLLGATWTTEDKGTSANITGTLGDTSEHSTTKFGMYSIVLKHNILDSLHAVLQHDHGYAEGVAVPGGAVKDAEWYGVNGYLMYDILDNLGIGIRGEWFRDQDGFRVCSPGRVAAATNDSYGAAFSSAASFLSNCQPASYYELTVGLNYKPLKWITLRPNIRYDWVDGRDTSSGLSYKPFGNGDKSEQFLFSADAIITF